MAREGFARAQLEAEKTAKTARAAVAADAVDLAAARGALKAQLAERAPVTMRKLLSKGTERGGAGARQFRTGNRGGGGGEGRLASFGRARRVAHCLERP